MNLSPLHILPLALLLVLSPAGAKGPAIKDYPVDLITKNAYVIHGPLGTPTPENQGFMNNPGFIITNKGIIVVDPGSSIQIGEMLLRAIRKTSDKPVIAVFNTHIHGDHWLGNQAIQAAYPNVPIYGHPNMITLIEDGEGDSWVALMERLTDKQTVGTKVVAPTIAINDGDEFKFGNTSVRIHHYGIAHTTSDVMIEIPEVSITFLGDNVLSQRIPRIDEGTFQGNIEACNRIQETGSKFYVPGHGPTGDVNVPINFCRYLETLYATVKKYYNEGLSDFEMKDKVAAQLTEYSDWSGFDVQLGKHISLAYLQIEEADF
ncbi:MBL-fold metallo-hydrolase superfamily [hydrothermal vent metagenome]|uniref:MBL-fold metallo-hydrolase superfamily n=1 Tax=hydrothermal vent metagenome TaxID=652676 RepID=A0A3B0Y9J8_9ZZZZ